MDGLFTECTEGPPASFGHHLAHIYRRWAQMEQWTSSQDNFSFEIFWEEQALFFAVGENSPSMQVTKLELAGA